MTPDRKKALRRAELKLTQIHIAINDSAIHTDGDQDQDIADTISHARSLLKYLEDAAEATT